MDKHPRPDVDELINNPQFRRWVRENRPADTAYWEEWQRQHPDRQEAVNQARQWLLTLFDELNDIDDEEVRWRVNALKERAAQQASDEETAEVRPLGRQSIWWIAAMVAGLLIGAFAWQYNNEPTSTVAASYDVQQVMQEVSERAPADVDNSGTKSALINLPDGSTVTLSPKSRLRYARDLDQQTERRVYLTGEAFFQVKRNPARPFKVFANGTITKVLGTSFLIRAYPAATDVMVSVRTGKVSVFTHPKNSTKPVFDNLQNGIVLTPNQQVVYSIDNEKLIKSLVDKPQLLLTVDPRFPAGHRANFEFDDTPLAEVFRRLEQAYGVEIIYDAESMKHCILTASLNNESLYEQLTVICKVASAQYEVIEGRIVVQGHGCQ